MPNQLTQSLSQPQSSLNYLDAIKQIESSGGTDPKMYKPNKYGALGPYQLTPPLYKDIQKYHPEFKNISFEKAALDPSIAPHAANAGLDTISQQLDKIGVDPTMHNNVQAYHSGIGNVKNGTIGPQGKDYMKKFHELTGGQYGS